MKLRGGKTLKAGISIGATPPYINYNSDADRHIASARRYLEQQMAANDGDAPEVLCIMTSQAIKPQVFNGNQKSDVRAYFEWFRKCQTYSTWSDEKTLQALLLYLEGEAKVFYRRLENETKEDLDLLEVAFLEKYDGEVQKWQLQSELYALKQKGSVMDFAYRLSDLTQRLQVNDQSKLDLFMQGLDPNFKNHVLLARPATYEDAVSIRKLKESFKEEPEVDVLINAERSFGKK